MTASALEKASAEHYQKEYNMKLTHFMAAALWLLSKAEKLQHEFIEMGGLRHNGVVDLKDLQQLCGEKTE